MRWFWIDRFEQFVSGQRAVAIKNVTLAEDHLHSGPYRLPLMPASLVLEGMAQTGGLLLAEAIGYASRVVLGKVASARFHFPPQPGDTLVYTATLESRGPDGARLAALSHVHDRLQAEAEYFLAILPTTDPSETLFDPIELAHILRILRIYDVGRTPSGDPLEMPAQIAESERAAAGLA
jgi:3-hydroxyacyl-[acyl-carrier-protein] dehydratase